MDRLIWNPSEPSQLQIDAARYRWLREQHWEVAELGVVFEPRQVVKLGHYCPYMERLDALIDEAMMPKLEK